MSISVENSIKDSVVNFFNRAKEQVEGWIKNLNLDTGQVLKYLGFVTVGFFAGILFKKFSKSFVIFLLAFAITLVLLNHYNIVDFNWNAIRDVTGVQATDTLEQLGEILFAWFKAYMGPIVAIAIGFVLGCKVS